MGSDNGIAVINRTNPWRDHLLFQPEQNLIRIWPYNRNSWFGRWDYLGDKSL